MSFPLGVQLRQVTFGVPFALANGDDLIMEVTFTPTRSMVWAATGAPGIARSYKASNNVGLQGSISLPVTDQAGWLDGLGSTLSVSSGAQTHLYVVDVLYKDASGTIIAKAPTRNLPLPAGDMSPIDLDLLIPVSTTAGVVLSVPDTWSADVTAAQAAAAAAAASAAVAGVLTVTAVKTASYSAGANELVPVDASSASVSVTLPAAPADKTRETVKKIDSSTNTVVVQRGGTSDLFNKAGGPTSVTLTVPNQAVTLQYAHATGLWIVVDDDLPLSQLDLRFDTAGAAAKRVATWQPTTAYTAGTVVLSPSGYLVQAKTDFTSGASYSATNWTQLSIDPASVAATYQAKPSTGTPSATTYLRGDGAWATPPGGATSTTTIDLATYAGADPTGSTDSTTAITNALAAVPAGGTLRIEGKYLSSGVTVTSRNDITISGSGTVTCTNPANPVFHFTSCTNVSIVGKVKATHQTATTRNSSGYGYQFDSCTNVTVLGAHATSTTAAGIIFFGGSNLKVIACAVTATLADGIHFSGGATDFTAFGNEVLNAGDDGIAVVSYQYNSAATVRGQITGNNISGYINTGGRGIAVVGGEDISITGNGVTGIAFAGIYIAQETTSGAATRGVKNVTITGNRVTNANQNSSINYPGIDVEGYDVSWPITNVTIANNIVTTPRWRGINVFASIAGRVDNVTVTGNQVNGNTLADGIIVDVVGMAAQVSGNRVTYSYGNGIYISPNNASAVADGNVVYYPNQGNTSGKTGIYGGPTTGVGAGGLVVPDPGKASITSLSIGWAGSGGVTATAGGMSDAFNGTDGGTLDSAKWTVTRGTEGAAPAGGIVFLSNQARVTTANNANAYTHAEATGMTAQADTDLRIDVTAGQQTGTAFVGIDSLNSDLSATNHGNSVKGFYCQLHVSSTAANSDISIWQNNVNLSGLTTKTITSGTQYTIRFKRTGLTLQAKVWQTSTTEPATWDSTYTLTSRPQQLGNGSFGAMTGPSPSAAQTFDFDNFLAI